MKKLASFGRLPLITVVLFFLALFITKIGRRLEPHFAKFTQYTIDGKEKSKFVIIISSQDNAPFVAKNLDSVFDQKYNNYRIIFIDDSSSDDTYKKALEFVQGGVHQDKITFISNPKQESILYNLYYAIQSCADDEVVVLLDGKDWLATPYVLSELNRYYKDEDVWMLFGQEVTYPDYSRSKDKSAFFRSLKKGLGRSFGLFSNLEQEMNGFLHTFYAGLFKQIKMQDLLLEGGFLSDFWQLAILFPMTELSRKHSLLLPQVMVISNLEKKRAPSAINPKEKRQLVNHLRALSPYAELKTHPKFGFQKPTLSSSDLVVFSEDRPLQLYSFLESVKKHTRGFDEIHICYTASDPQFEKGYQVVQKHFPACQFHKNTSEFPQILERLLISTNNRYITFSNDQIVLKEALEVPSSVFLLEKTGAYGFFYHLGLHLDALPRQMISIGDNCYLWQFSLGEKEWKKSNNLQMTLYRKSDVSSYLHYTPIDSAPEFCAKWSRGFDVKRLGLCCQNSKALEVPMQVIRSDREETIALYSKEELNDRLLEGFKMDISPLSQMNNKRIQIEFYPFFLPIE